MDKDKRVYLNDLGILCALGEGASSVFDNLILGVSPGMRAIKSPLRQADFYVGQVVQDLPELSLELNEFDCRNNRLAQVAITQIASTINRCKEIYGVDRVGVVIGTSTSGIGEAEIALTEFQASNEFPDNYHYKKQEIGSVAEFVARSTGVEGPAYVVSTACSSSGKVFASARNLIQQGICDAVIVGGVDSLCELTLSGFASLEATTATRTNPFSKNRAGINIGEAAAFFVMTAEPASVTLLGVGESSDAYHMSAPEPSGEGALRAMQLALREADISANQIDYINLHGTGTALNDAMESHAVSALFGDSVQTSSTKPLTGHTLGAAGAVEAAIGWLLLKNNNSHYVAPHIYDGQYDCNLSRIALCETNASQVKLKRIMSNSFAFGGNNVSVILGNLDDN